MSGHRLRSAGALLAAFAALVLAATVPVARAQEAPVPDEARQVLAIVSPLANPVCTTAGSATLLVPVVGGLVSDQLQLGEQLNIADVVLDALGPVYVTCGTLPGADGTRCALIDDQIVALYPTQLADTGLTAPPLGGNLVEALSRAGEVLGLPLGELFEPALQCSIPTSPDSPSPPPPPPPLTPVAGALPQPDPGDPVPDSSPVGSSGPTMTPSLPAAVPSIDVTATPAPVAATGGTPLTTLEVIARTVSGSVRLLQLLVALALTGFLGSSWLRSWYEARRPLDG